MGRAIDMENDIDKLNHKVKKIEDTVRGMILKIDEISEKSSKTQHIDIVQSVGAEIEDTKGKDNEKKKTNDKRDSKDADNANSKPRKSTKKSV